MNSASSSPVWRDAIAVSKAVVEMCEDFSNQESNVLLSHLRGSVIDIPAGIATNLNAGQKIDMGHIIRLQAIIELIHGVYPAIETRDVIERLDLLVKRIEGGHSQEQ